MSETIIFGSSKTYDHNAGLSCCFRQWKAQSHCNKMHGYALKIRLEFETERLDNTNWVVDFGGLKGFKQWLEEEFDHKTIVASDDPHFEWFKEGHDIGTLDMIALPNVGCEAFATHILGHMTLWLQSNGYSPRVKVVKVEVSEHTGNSAWARINGQI